MNNFLSGKKKIITMLLGVLSGIAIVFGIDMGEVSTIAGAVVSVISVVGYLIAEGKIDVERIRNTAVDIGDALEVIQPGVIVEGFGRENEDEESKVD